MKAYFRVIFIVWVGLALCALMLAKPMLYTVYIKNYLGPSKHVVYERMYKHFEGAIHRSCLHGIEYKDEWRDVVGFNPNSPNRYCHKFKERLKDGL